MRKSAFLGRDGSECRRALHRVLAATIGAGYGSFFEIIDVKALSKLFVAVLAEKYVLGHGRFLL
jgi:hypothetical protein